MPRTRPTSPKQAADHAAVSVGGKGNGSTLATRKKAHRNFTTDEIVEALYETGGLVAQAADLLKCERTTIYRRMIEPAIADAIKLARHFSVDDAENSLRDRVRKGDTTAIIFMLKTLGKDRGYVERMEMTGKDGEPVAQRIEVVYVDTDHND